MAMGAELRVAQYRFIDRLAVGGMAEVFIAIAQSSGGFERPVVVKRLLPHLNGDRRFREMFLDEARIMASLQHGNIVQILDVGILDELPFLTLEYVDGRDLRTVLQRAEHDKSPLPTGLMAYVISEACRGLDYAHRKRDDEGHPLGIIHRDVNPANIFLSHEGVVKVGDFGLAKAFGSLSQSEAGIVKGKISYLSPEQARGEPLDHRSDIFSLGTTLYEATCGQLPFAGTNDPEIIMSVRDGDFTRPTEVVPDYPAALEAIVLRAMHPDREQRYSTAGDMCADLVQYVHQLPESTDDRALTELLATLFGRERRSKSFLIRLPTAEALPPTVLSVAQTGPFHEYRRAEQEGKLPELRRAKPTPRIAEPPANAKRSGSLRSPPVGAWIAVIALLVVAISVVLFFAYKLARNQETARLRVVSVPPGARVLVDGTDVGQRTPTVLNQLDVRREYVVELRHPQADPVERRFRLLEPRYYTHMFRMPLRYEDLAVDSTPPNADVLVDGDLRGQTPLSIRLPFGKHQIVLKKQGYVEKAIKHVSDKTEAPLRIVLDRVRPEIAPEPQPPATTKQPKVATTSVARNVNKPSKLKPKLAAANQSAPGMVVVDIAEPAKVYINGRYAGTTPNFQTKLPEGQYAFKIVPTQGKKTYQGSLTVRAGTVQRVHLLPQ